MMSYRWSVWLDKNKLECQRWGHSFILREMAIQETPWYGVWIWYDFPVALWNNGGY